VTADLSPRAREIVSVARELLEREGADALTMRALAARLGIRAPSLYKHFGDKEELETAIIAVGFEEAAVAIETAARSARSRPLAAIARAYRRFALERPHLYRLMNDRPLRRDLLPDGVEARAAAPLLEAVGSLERARAAWAFAHGMVTLEINGRFPADADLDRAWTSGIAAFEPRPVSRAPSRSPAR
jgi:AcrR family transcriptional regulator